MKLNVGNNTVRNAFTDPANMSRWVQNFEAVDKDHTRRTPWFRFTFTGSKELISRFTGVNIHERTWHHATI